MRTYLAALFGLLLAAGCTAGGGTVVKGAGPNELLKLREGPGLNYRIIVGLPDGTRLRRQECVTKNAKLWCRVSLAARPGVWGYVAAEYLSES